MAQQSKRPPYRQISRQTNYIDGNNARKLMPVPEREINPVRNPAPKKRERQARAINVNKGIDFVTMLFLCAVIAVTVAVCFRYLEIHSENKELDKMILAEKATLSELEDENNFIESEFNQPIDFNEIKQKAIAELGMRALRDNEVILYEDSKAEYVNPREAIEEIKISDILDKLFGN